MSKTNTSIFPPVDFLLTTLTLCTWDLLRMNNEGFFIIELISLNSIICFVSAINNLDKFGSVYGVWFIDSLGRL